MIIEFFLISGSTFRKQTVWEKISNEQVDYTIVFEFEALNRLRSIKIFRDYLFT